MIVVVNIACKQPSRSSLKNQEKTSESIYIELPDIPSIDQNYAEILQERQGRARLSLRNFKIVPLANNNGEINMNNLKYKYERITQVPQYVNAKYNPEEYDYDVAFDRVRRAYYKNPFILNHRWE